MTLRTLLRRLVSPLGLILLLALVLRVAGVGYGLPLIVVNDEYPFTYAALQMLQTKTLIPAFRPDAFADILPYPPYISYVLLLPFAVIIGVKMLLWSGAADLFTAHLLTDLSAFFITARLGNVILGTLSVFLVYRIAQALFLSQVAARAAAFLLATSLLHIALSMVGRNWLPVSFVFLLVLFILTRGIPKERRYLYAFIAAGIGMGISSISTLALALIGLYYICLEARDFKQILRDVPRMIAGVFAFISLALLPALLWQGGNAFLGATTLFEAKSFVGLLSSPLQAISLTIYSEPVLMAAFLIGLVALFVRERRKAALIASAFLLYVGVFYLFFRFDARFMLPLVPLYALAGGYAFSQILEATPQGWRVSPLRIIVISLLIVIPLTTSARLSYLAYQGDTRAHAREWVLENLGATDRILVYGSALRIPTQSEAVTELRTIDQNALRKVDVADERLNRKDVPYVLNNLTSLIDTPFMQTLPAYAQEHGYTYAIVEPRSLEGTQETAEVFEELTEGADVIAHFSGLGTKTSIWESAFLEPLPALFSDKILGPDIFVYRLSY